MVHFHLTTVILGETFIDFIIFFFFFFIEIETKLCCFLSVGLYKNCK